MGKIGAILTPLGKIWARLGQDKNKKSRWKYIYHNHPDLALILVIAFLTTLWQQLNNILQMFLAVVYMRIPR